MWFPQFQSFVPNYITVTVEKLVMIMCVISIAFWCIFMIVNPIIVKQISIILSFLLICLVLFGLGNGGDFQITELWFLGYPPYTRHSSPVITIFRKSGSLLAYASIWQSLCNIKTEFFLPTWKQLMQNICSHSAHTQIICVESMLTNLISNSVNQPIICNDQTNSFVNEVQRPTW